jgi:hypothetical protein
VFHPSSLKKSLQPFLPVTGTQAASARLGAVRSTAVGLG